jgi:hypothetical protein
MLPIMPSSQNTMIAAITNQIIVAISTSIPSCFGENPAGSPPAQPPASCLATPLRRNGAAHSSPSMAGPLQHTPFLLPRAQQGPGRNRPEPCHHRKEVRLPPLWAAVRHAILRDLNRASQGCTCIRTGPVNRDRDRVAVTCASPCVASGAGHRRSVAVAVASRCAAGIAGHRRGIVVALTGRRIAPVARHGRRVAVAQPGARGIVVARDRRRVAVPGTRLREVPVTRHGRRVPVAVAGVCGVPVPGNGNGIVVPVPRVDTIIAVAGNLDAVPVTLKDGGPDTR